MTNDDTHSAFVSVRVVPTGKNTSSIIRWLTIALPAQWASFGICLSILLSDKITSSNETNPTEKILN